jgi:CheY-like chemotaxis protein
MTTEETQSPAEVGDAPDNGQGQSQGHRRRRRRRKNKGSQSAAGAQPQAAQQAPVQQAPAPAPPQAAPQQQQPRQQQPRQQPKKKRKPFQKSTESQAQPGNSTALQGQKMRKSKPKGPREFVGPMDHSYRVVNGNIADGPSSTIQMGASRMTHWEEPYAPPVPIRHDAPARIFCFIEDLFFLAKIQETARKLGVKIEFVKGADKEAVARTLDLPEGERPALVVFDLNNPSVKPMTLIPKLKSKYKKTVSIVGFLSHLQGDLKAKAVEAGCDTVMPRSAFSQTLPNLLRRYGIEEEEEYSPQPM